MHKGSVSPRGDIREKVTHISGKRSDRAAAWAKGHACTMDPCRPEGISEKRSRIFPVGEATEAPKERKVTHDSGKQSDRGVAGEKGHA